MEQRSIRTDEILDSMENTILDRFQESSDENGKLIRDVCKKITDVHGRIDELCDMVMAIKNSEVQCNILHAISP